jgi:sigma-B regulation protein RsbU (phosphoserine phosphatase)
MRFKLEISFALLAVLSYWTWSSGSLLSGLILGLAAAVLGGILFVRWGRVALRQLIWHLRDRLIVAYFFIAVIPIAVIVLAARWVVLDLGGQIAVYLVNSGLDRRVGGLEDIAKSLAQVPESRRGAMLDQIATLFEDRFPGLRVQLVEGAGDMGPSGVIVRQGLLYIRARAAHQQVRVALLAPLNRSALASLAPGLGPVSIIGLDAASSLKLHPSPADAEIVELPPSMNRFDIELRWASQIPVADFDDPSRTHEALLGVRSRVSALLRTLFAASTGRADLRNDMMLAGILLLLAQVISVYIGVSVTRAITQAFSGLYAGTQRVMRGDFSHPVPVKGDDQIAEVTTSFNQMTSNIERLLEVSKEKERFEAELAIARQVQDQLFPRGAPELQTLELRAVCHAARMVSGDYYDYQPLAGSKTAFLLADVAGKGVSAALLMASLQACFRMQAHDLRADPSRPACTSALVSRINQQLHASTSPEKFATFFFAMYDDVTGELTYTNAGHLPPILVRCGEARFLDVNGMVVGAFAFAKYDESRLQLEPGDLLFGYTDGVTEAENEFGEMFGEERLVAVLCQHCASEPPAIFQAVADAVKQFTGTTELQDDMTMIIARRKAG